MSNITTSIKCIPMNATLTEKGCSANLRAARRAYTQFKKSGIARDTIDTARLTRCCECQRATMEPFYGIDKKGIILAMTTRERKKLRNLTTLGSMARKYLGAEAGEDPLWADPEDIHNFAGNTSALNWAWGMGK